MTPRFVFFAFSIAFILAATFAAITTVRQVHGHQATIADQRSDRRQYEKMTGCTPRLAGSLMARTLEGRALTFLSWDFWCQQTKNAQHRAIIGFIGWECCRSARDPDHR